MAISVYEDENYLISKVNFGFSDEYIIKKIINNNYMEIGLKYSYEDALNVIKKHKENNSE